MRLVPGFPNMAQGAGGLTVVYRTSQQNVDVWADAGSPTVPVFVSVVVESGVNITSASIATPAMDFTGFVAGSKGSLLNVTTAVIEAAGGQGADGISFNQRHSGAGGGGAGNIPGPGGVSIEPAADGSPGTSGVAGVGGAGGIGQDGGSSDFSAGVDGEPGGDAIRLGQVDLIIMNAGAYILGGGGGGGGGEVAAGDSTNGGAGGDHGQDGTPGDTTGNSIPGNGDPGIGGYAIKYLSGGSVTFISGGSAPNVQGDVGL